MIRLRCQLRLIPSHLIFLPYWCKLYLGVFSPALTGGFALLTTGATQLTRQAYHKGPKTRLCLRVFAVKMPSIAQVLSQGVIANRSREGRVAGREAISASWRWPRCHAYRDDGLPFPCQLCLLGAGAPASQRIGVPQPGKGYQYGRDG